jgi:tRNA1Val (adenine37-N6)-methyltransferase
LSQVHFNFKSFSILNPQKGLKVTTDACLLGAVADFSEPQSMIDIGCGSGVIALMLAQKHPKACILAIDIDKNAIENTDINIRNSRFSNHFELIHDDFLSHVFDDKIDLLVCNPPYFKNHLQNFNSDKRTAIHNSTLDFNLLIDKAISIMHKDSLFWLILPPYEMSVFIKMAENKLLHVHSLMSIYNQTNKHFRDIVCLSLIQDIIPKKNHLLMFDSNKQMTKEYQSLMFPFYLDK